MVFIQVMELPQRHLSNSQGNVKLAVTELLKKN